MKSGYPIMRAALYIILGLCLVACSTARQVATQGPLLSQTPDQALIASAVEGTVQTVLTEAAADLATDTPATLQVSETTEATITTTPSATALPPVATNALALHALFISDVTIPDGSILAAGAPFTKTWRIQNIGAETWTTEFSLVFVNGDRMAGEPINLPFQVLPGQVVDLSITMVAPDQAGEYSGFWMLSTEDDTIFGIGENANQALLVAIEVIAPTATPGTPTATATP